MRMGFAKRGVSSGQGRLRFLVSRADGFPSPERCPACLASVPMDDKSKRDKEVRDVYKREKSSRKRTDDPEAMERQQTLRDLENAIHWQDKRKFLEFLRTAGISDGSEKFRQLVELYDQLHSRW